MADNAILKSRTPKFGLILEAVSPGEAANIGAIMMTERMERSRGSMNSKIYLERGNAL